jgi:hypothetical protein
MPDLPAEDIMNTAKLAVVGTSAGSHNRDHVEQPLSRVSAIAHTHVSFQGRMGLVICFLQPLRPGVRDHLLPYPFRLPHDHCITVPECLIGKQGWVNAAQDHGSTSVPELPGQFISPVGIRCHTADADKIAIFLKVYTLQLLFEDTHFVPGRSQTGDQMEGKLGDHEALRFFETGILAGRDQ